MYPNAFYSTLLYSNPHPTYAYIIPKLDFFWRSGVKVKKELAKTGRKRQKALRQMAAEVIELEEETETEMELDDCKSSESD